MTMTPGKTMKKKEETRVFNPILLIAAILMAGIALFAGYWLVSQQETPIAVAPQLAGEKPEPAAKEKEEPAQDSKAPQPKKPVEEAPVKTVTSISGSVVEADTPIRVFSAKVQAYRQGREPLEVVTNSNGEFVFKDIEPGAWRLRATKEGFASVSAETDGAFLNASPISPAQNVILRLVPPVPLEGKVLNVIGKEVPNATIQIFDGRNTAGVKVSALVRAAKTDKSELDLLSVKNPLAEVTSGADGIFRFTDLEAGTYSLVAFAHGYSRKTALGAKTETTDTVFHLEPEVRVFGQVNLAPANTPVVGASISVTVSVRDAPEISGKIVSSSTGAYSLGGLPRQFALKLRGYYKEAESALYTATFSGGVSQRKQDVLIFEKRRILGNVVDASEHKPVNGVGVLLGNRLHPLSEVTQTDAQGHFEITTGITSNNLVIGKREGFEDLTFPVEFTGDVESINLGEIQIIQGVKVSGRVVSDKKSGVEGALVRAIPVEGNLADPAAAPNIRSNNSGDYILPLVPPGKYYLSAEAAGFKTGYYGDPKPATEGAHPALIVHASQPLKGIQIPVVTAPAFVVKGKVLDATGTSVIGAQLRLQLVGAGKGTEGPKTTSQEDGVFLFKEVPSGRYILNAEKEGFWPTLLDRVQPESRMVATDVIVVLEKKNILTISGKVTDAMGGPLNSAEVAAFAGSIEALVTGGLLTPDLLPSWRDLEALSAEQLGNGSVMTAKTNADGTYMIEKLHPGLYSVIAVDSESGTSDILFDVDAGASGVDFQLGANLSLRGTVMLPDGTTPCKAFTLDAFVAGGGTPVEGKSSTGMVSHSVQSEDGSFEMTGLAPGQYTLNVQSEGQGEASTAFEILRDETPPDLKLVLNSGGSITGMVVGGDGKPAADATVGLGDLQRAVLPDGSFSFLGLPPDRYALVVTHPDYAPVIASNIAVQEGKPSNVGTIQLGEGGDIEGFARFSNGAGAGDYVIKAEPSGGMTNPTNVDLFVTRTDDSGHFRLSGVGVGPYRLQLRSASKGGSLAQSGYGQVLQSRFVTVNEGQTTSVQLVIDNGTRISGKVTMGGKPWASSTLVLYPRFRTEVTEFVAVTDRIGNYSFEGVPPGNYEAVAGEFSVEQSKSMMLTVPDQPAFTQNFSF